MLSDRQATLRADSALEKYRNACVELSDAESMRDYRVGQLQALQQQCEEAERLAREADELVKDKDHAFKAARAAANRAQEVVFLLK